MDVIRFISEENKILKIIILFCILTLQEFCGVYLCSGFFYNFTYWKRICSHVLLYLNVINIVYIITWHFITEDTSCAKIGSGGVVSGWGAWMECSCRVPPFYAEGQVRTPPDLRVLGTLHAEDALRTVLNVGLHNSCRLHRGGCNPILFGGAVVQPVRRKRTLLCALTLSPPLLPFQPRVTLFLPHLFTPCSLRLVGGAQTSGIVASHCSPTDRASF